MPKVKLTKTACDAAHPSKDGKSLIYWDEELTEFGLIAHQNSKSFIAQHDLNGKSTRVNTGKCGIYTPPI